MLEVRNNNIYTDQAIIDVWAKYDSVSAPYVLAPTLETALGNAASEAYIEEPLVFTASCGPVSAFVDTYYATPNATEFPENWCIGGEGETGLFPDQVDLSYSTDAASFSAGDDNYPLGNLNYFPDMKAKWEAGAVIGVEEKQIAVGNVSLRNYPNPFSNSTTIAYDLKTSATVSLELYNAAGSKIRRLVNEYQQAGTQQVTVDASDLPGGLYFIKLDTGTSVYVGKMLHTK
ncbi:MAG: T9SS type A sorting domain-containing protein [Bacteroidales bacterium]|nr:T9SS type A sorting domain-containing protein [Bacteroidales bacterium]